MVNLTYSFEFYLVCNLIQLTIQQCNETASPTNAMSGIIKLIAWSTSTLRAVDAEAITLQIATRTI